MCFVVAWDPFFLKIDSEHGPRDAQVGITIASPRRPNHVIDCVQGQVHLHMRMKKALSQQIYACRYAHTAMYISCNCPGHHCQLGSLCERLQFSWVRLTGGRLFVEIHFLFGFSAAELPQVTYCSVQACGCM